MTIGKAQQILYNKLMNVQPDQIKKLRVRYLKCTRGQLHEGEVLNFICIDPACRTKGLICPVCQNTTHEGHQTLHLKLFLAQINRTLYHQQDTSELSGLTQYLRSLDNSKRQMLKYLKDTVEQLAQQVRVVEDKIEKGYCLLRKVILSQSTVSMRLPQLYRLLTDAEAGQDQEEVLKQITRYSQLLEYKDGKLITVDSAKNLVVEYASRAGSLSARLATAVAEVTKIFTTLPLEVNKFGAKEEVLPASSAPLTFSLKQKTPTITITDGKAIRLSEDAIGGIAFTTLDASKTSKKASFKITALPEGDLVTIGVANPHDFETRNFEINLQGEQSLYGMCSLGFLPQDLEGEAFLYSTGDTIDVTWTPTEKKLVFARRHGLQICETILPTEDPSNLTFFVALSTPGTKIQLVQ